MIKSLKDKIRLKEILSQRLYPSAPEFQIEGSTIAEFRGTERISTRFSPGRGEEEERFIGVGRPKGDFA